jgi:hypothetical protein
MNNYTSFQFEWYIRGGLLVVLVRMQLGITLNVMNNNILDLKGVGMSSFVYFVTIVQGVPYCTPGLQKCVIEKP